MEPNPYESPLHAEAATEKVDLSIRPNWKWVCFLLLSVAFYCLMLYEGFSEYARVGFVGGDGLSAEVRWGLRLTVWPAATLNACFCIWKEFRPRKVA